MPDSPEHQAGCLDWQGHRTPPPLSLIMSRIRAADAASCGVIWLHEQLEVSEIPGEAVRCAKPFSEGCLHGGVGRADHRIIQVPERLQPGQADFRRPMAPRGHERRLFAVARAARLPAMHEDQANSPLRWRTRFARRPWHRARLCEIVPPPRPPPPRGVPKPYQPRRMPPGERCVVV